MHPARVMTTPPSSRSSPSPRSSARHRPDLARRKAWEGIFAEFGTGRESDPWQAWESLADHAGGMLAVWVLWDAAAEPVLPGRAPTRRSSRAAPRVGRPT